jgi:Tfp pilus assembly protein PilE
VVTGDQVSLVNGTAIFASKNAGAWTVTDTGLSLSGADAGNYTVNGTATAAAEITTRPITVAAVPNVKIYDGTVSASAVSTITSGSLVAGDAVAFSETYSTKNVGIDETLTPSGSVNDGDGGANYCVTFVASATGTITQTADHFLVTASPANVTAGNNSILTVTAEDAGGHVVVGYAGTVEFNSSDPLEPVPAGNLIFTPGTGLAAAMATLETAGSWAITLRTRRTRRSMAPPRSWSRQRPRPRSSSASSLPTRPLAQRSPARLRLASPAAWPPSAGCRSSTPPITTTAPPAPVTRSGPATGA